MKRFYFLITLALLGSCSEKTDLDKTAYSINSNDFNPFEDNSIKIIPEVTKYESFEVAYLDYIDSTSLQRVFIAINKQDVNDTVMI